MRSATDAEHHEKSFSFAMSTTTSEPNERGCKDRDQIRRSSHKAASANPSLSDTVENKRRAVSKCDQNQECWMPDIPWCKTHPLTNDRDTNKMKLPPLRCTSSEQARRSREPLWYEKFENLFPINKNHSSHLLQSVSNP